MPQQWSRVTVLLWASVAAVVGVLLAGCGGEKAQRHSAPVTLAGDSVAMNGISSACDLTAVAGVDALCPTWLPGGNGDQWAGGPVGGVGRCSYLVSITGPSSTDSIPFHVMFGGRCKRFSLTETSTRRWPTKPDFVSYLGLIGEAPSKPGRRQDISPLPVKVFKRTTVGSNPALVLQIPHHPNAGIQKGHYAIVWNHGHDSYELSFHYELRAERGQAPTRAELEDLRRAASAMTRPLP